MKSNNNHRRSGIRLGGLTLALAALILVLSGIIKLSPGSSKSADLINPSPTAAQTAAATAADTPTPGATAATPTASEATATPTATAEPTASPTPSPSSPDIFTTGDVQYDDTSYQSSDLNVKITNVQKDGVNYYVADCTMKDGNQFFSAFALDHYVLHKGERASTMAQRKGAVVAINGDYYGHADADRNDQGIVIRNGVLYRKSPWYDIAAIYKDGTMKTFDNTMSADQLMADGATQVLSFGPMLMDGNGKALSADALKKRHNANSPLNPRAGIGYIGPNHYVLVVVDGRGSGGSKGMTIGDFAKLFESLGCQNAYNLDGGGSATMVFMGKVLNHPCDPTGERQVSDIIYFGESETDQANIARFANH